MNEILTKIGNIGIVPVVVIKDADKAVSLARTLIEGGIPCAEVTFRTAAAREAICKMSQAYPELLLGAGTILTVEQAQSAVEAGAKFLVSPGYDQTLVDWTREHNVPYVPGVCTASEVQVAVANGFEVLKFFPAEAAGGVPMIKNLCGPFPQVKFMTTGGISNENIAPYATSKNVLAVGGSWMVKGDLIEAKDWDTIKAKCHEAIGALHGFAFKGVTISCPSYQLESFSAQLSAFGLASDTNFSKPDIHLSNSEEKTIGLVVSTYNLQRAVAYLSDYGFEANDNPYCENSCILHTTNGQYDIVLVQSK